MEFFRRSNKVAVLIFDGIEWKGFIPCLSLQSESFVSSVQIIPERLLHWVHLANVKVVRLVIPSDVNVSDLEMGDHLDPEETMSILSYELSSSTGHAADTIRPASVGAALLKLTEREGVLLNAIFTVQQLNSYERCCRKSGLIFDGMASLQLAFLTLFSEIMKNGEAFVLLRSQQTFIVVPSGVTKNLVVKNISIGSSEFLRNPTIWQSKIQQRFPSLQNHQICFFVDQSALELPLKNTVLPMLNASLTSFQLISNSLSSIAEVIAEQSQHVKNSLYPVVRESRPKTSPVRLILLIIAIFLLPVCYVWIQNYILNEKMVVIQKELDGLSGKKMTYQNLTQEFNQLKKRLDQPKEKLYFPERLNQIVLMMKIIQESIPKQVYIRSLELSQYTITLDATSDAQLYLTRFRDVLRSRLKDYQVVLSSDSIERQENQQLMSKMQFLIKTENDHE